MNVRLGVPILIVVAVLISEWNRREHVKTGLGYIQFSQISLNIVVAYLRITLYAYVN